MFFPEKISLIGPKDRVLEIGPGASPHFRSDAFLELNFDTPLDKIAQRGGGQKDANFGNRPIHLYDGKEFPFKDNEFDYVICSHVIEHVDNPDFFLKELFRVGGGRGYIEYPLITYEYLYNFDVHTLFVKYDSQFDTLNFLPKVDTNISEFLMVSNLLRNSLQLGWDDLVRVNKSFFFEGIEFEEPFLIRRVSNIGFLLPDSSLLKRKRFPRRLASYFFERVGL